MSTQQPPAAHSAELRPPYGRPTPRVLRGSARRDRRPTRGLLQPVEQTATGVPRETADLRPQPACSDRRVPAVVYLRRLPGADRDAVCQVLTGLVEFTARRGFALVAVHYEPRPGERLATWAALIMNCRSEGITDIVVPDPGHFHHDPEIAAFMREELAEKVRGAVWYVSEAVTTITGADRREY